MLADAFAFSRRAVLGQERPPSTPAEPLATPFSPLRWPAWSSTLPALYKSPSGAPTAFYAVVSIGVIGLYVAFAIPIWLRWRQGDAFKPGPWTLGNKYRWMSIVAVAEIAITSVYFLFPTTPQGIRVTRRTGRATSPGLR